MNERVKKCLGKKVAWVGEDDQEDAIYILFEDLTGLHIDSGSYACIDKGYEVGRKLLESKLAEAENVMNLDKLINQKATNDTQHSEPPKPIVAGTSEEPAQQ